MSASYFECSFLCVMAMASFTHPEQSHASFHANMCTLCEEGTLLTIQEQQDERVAPLEGDTNETKATATCLLPPDATRLLCLCINTIRQRNLKFEWRMFLLAER